jgi:O-antigen/teichoic acid export membrane protein
MQPPRQQDAPLPTPETGNAPHLPLRPALSSGQGAYPLGSTGNAPLPQPRPSLLRRLAHTLGVDRAVAFTVLARGWSSLAGIGTIVLIARFLSPAEQGFYYTFYSIVALQIVFELGFSVVILQTASHEAAHLQIAADGTITGPAAAHGRLADILQKSVRWYTAGAALMALCLMPVGLAFFRHADRGPRAVASVHYVLPWLFVVLASACTFQIDPLFSFLEGCGYVPEVARTRLRQSVCGTVLGWSAFLLHLGLFAPGCFILGQALAGGYLIYTKRPLLLPLLRHAIGGFRINWRDEVWPFQWRIAVSWLAGYITSQLFNPILLNSRGPVEAGQMGMSLAVCGTLTQMAVAWMNTKAAPFGRLIARQQYADLDRSFFRALWQSFAAAVLGCTAVWLGVALLGKWGIRSHGNLLASRFLAPVPLAMLLFGTLGNIIVFAEALYLRAHKQEKFMINSIAGAVYIAPLAYLLGRWNNPHGGAWGIAAAYAVGTLFIGLGYGTYTFLRWRRIWHAA